MSRKVITEEFIKRAKETHGDKYDYSLVNYQKAKTKVKIVCPVHGMFEQMPSMHLKGQGCPKCGTEATKKQKKMSEKEFESKASESHNFKYDYSLVKFSNLHEKIKIVCPIHGLFEQEANNHLRGQGCPECSKENGKSIGCKKIEKFLHDHQLKFETEKKFDGCKGKRNKLPFDYFVIDEKLLVEYDGSQHYFPKFGKKSFEELKINDKIKDEFCEKNGIRLLRIKYNQNNDIEKILKEELLWQKK